MGEIGAVLFSGSSDQLQEMADAGVPLLLDSQRCTLMQCA